MKQFMKTLGAMLLSVALVLASLSGCGQKAETTNAETIVKEEAEVYAEGSQQAEESQQEEGTLSEQASADEALTEEASEASSDEESSRRINEAARESRKYEFNNTFGGSMDSFTAKDVFGEEITEAIFADYDVTMINCWTTWCGYCIEEMPGLADLKGKLPENVNLITICFDAADEKELCLQEMNAAGVNFTVLEGNEELEMEVGRYVAGYPTTFFVDAEGYVIGPILVGAPRGSVADYYLNLINITLDALEE